MITLQDPQTGALVHLTLAALPQRCRFCGRELQGEWAMSTEETGWNCLEHAERILMRMPASPQFLASKRAREQLVGKAPGELTEVTGSLLAALGAV